MSEYLTFDPSEFTLLGDVIEMDEQVQREESVRFFTLDEQLTDSFDKLLPSGHATTFVLEQLAKEMDRFRDLYETYVNPTAEGYEIRPPEIRRSFPWIHPVYRSADLVRSNVSALLGEVLSKENRRLPNGYTRMLGVLPRPYPDTPSKPLQVATEFVDTEGKAPLRALPPIILSQTKYLANGKTAIVPVPVEGTEDKLGSIGFFLEERVNEIPNPREDHDFFKDKQARFIQTDEDLQDIVPQIPAIMEHGVPVTTDPYREGLKFLKVYDVTLQSIPWEEWQRRFPQVEIGQPAPVVELAFPKSDTVSPDEKLIKEYATSYSPAWAPRAWLMNQPDAGFLVVQMLLSEAGSAGVVPVLPSADLSMQYPAITMDKCGLTDLTFQEFLVQGLVRRVNAKLQCIPLEIVQQERKQIGLGRIPWKDQTKDAILSTYRRILATMLPAKVEKKPGFVGTKAPVKAVSELRQTILAILADVHRKPDDKVRAINSVLKSVPNVGKQYIENGAFVVCEHTLSALKEEDMTQWIVRELGVEYCQVCGEQINGQVLVDQAEYDEGGRRVVQSAALDTNIVHGHAIASFTTGLKALLPRFTMTDPADATLYLLLSLLQVLPEGDQLAPILSYGRQISLALGKKDDDATRRARGMVGIAEAVMVMQTHRPPLLARRSFGPKPLRFDGYPRDTSESTGFTVIDVFLMVLRKTFEAYPTSFQGPSLQVMRGTLNDPKVIRKGVVGLLGKFVPQFKQELLNAKDVAPLAVPEPNLLLPIAPMPPTERRPLGFAACPSTRIALISGIPPDLGHPLVPLRKPILIQEPVHFVEQGAPQGQVPFQASDADIRAGLAVKEKPLFMTDSWKINVLLLQRISSATSVGSTTSVDPTQPAAKLRDLTQGMLKIQFREVSKDPVKVRAYEALKTDITMVMLLTSLDDARKESNTLRAKERHTFTDRLRNMTDADREITKELIDRGLAPYIITNADREEFARQLERELEPDLAEAPPEDADTGVGKPVDDENEEDGLRPDGGDYGDNQAQGDRDREEYIEPLDENGPI